MGRAMSTNVLATPEEVKNGDFLGTSQNGAKGIGDIGLREERFRDVDKRRMASSRDPY